MDKNLKSLYDVENVLWLMRLQKDFILDDGLAVLPGGKAIVPNVVKAVEIARKRGILVIWVMPFFLSSLFKICF